MKTLALLAILALQSTGTWERLPETHQDRLTSTAAGTVAPAASPAAITFPAAALPVRTTEAPPPILNAVSAIAVDRATGTVLYTHNADAQRPIASITKLVTALVVSSGQDPQQRLTVPELPD